MKVYVEIWDHSTPSIEIRREPVKLWRQIKSRLSTRRWQESKSSMLKIKISVSASYLITSMHAPFMAPQSHDWVPTSVIILQFHLWQWKGQMQNRQLRKLNEMLLEEEKQKEAIEQQQRDLIISMNWKKRSKDSWSETSNLWSLWPVNIYQLTHPRNVSSFATNGDTSPHMAVSTLAPAFQENMALNRLPFLEPFIFNGDPIKLIEWKSSFTFLIDKTSLLKNCFIWRNMWVSQHSKFWKELSTGMMTRLLEMPGPLIDMASLFSFRELSDPNLQNGQKDRSRVDHCGKLLTPAWFSNHFKIKRET